MKRSPRRSIEALRVLLIAIVSALAASANPLRAQQPPAPIPLEKEPHHELVFHNKNFLAFRVKMSPGDALLLHRHAYDEAALTISCVNTPPPFSR